MLAGAGTGAYTLYTPDLHCAEGVARPEKGAECIGVSSDGYDFGIRPLRQVTRAIGRENASALSAKAPYATVALLLPLTSADPGYRTKVLHELQGAFLAQYRANHLSNNLAPKIRLALANAGSADAHAPEVVRQLLTMTDAPDHLRAVSGVGTSSAAAQDAVRELTKNEIAVVGTTITGDELANNAKREPYPGLARVSPTNSDEGRALTQVSRAEADKALLVEDKRTGDYYTSSLKTAFNKLLKDSPYPARQFSSPEDPTEDGTTSNTFLTMTGFICATEATTIYFAGRHTQLRQFVNALGARGCQTNPYTIVTGDEGSYLGTDTKLDRSALNDKPGLHNKITVRYAALAHPEAWADAHTTPPTGGATKDFTDFTGLLSEAARPGIGPIGRAGADSLFDGQAIIAYDALTTAVAGIRTAMGESGTLPEPVDVGRQWAQMTGPERVNGASGWICLDNYGNPQNKAVPIVELSGDGRPSFVKIAWPEGKPPPNDCVPTAGTS